MTHVHALSQYREFFHKWGRSVLTYCQLSLGDQKAAEEATAEVFAKYFDEVNSTFNGRVRLTLESVPLSLMRKMAAVVESSPVLPFPGDASDLEKAIALLSRKQRSVFILRTVIGLSADQVGVVLGMTLAQVNTSFADALQLLRGLWLDAKTTGNSFFVSAMTPGFHGA